MTNDFKVFELTVTVRVAVRADAELPDADSMESLRLRCGIFSLLPDSLTSTKPVVEWREVKE